MQPPSSEDYYGVLNVNPSASIDEIQKAYKSLSKTFHPDRLRDRNPAELEFARETFVRIKAAHGILCDPVYRFVYDQYGNSGVQYLQLCERARESKQPIQRGNLPLETHLYGKLKSLLEQPQDQQLALAIDIFKRAIERFQQQVELSKERIRDSSFDFNATMELPCVHHPKAAALLGENASALPFLELEGAHMEFGFRATNQKAPKSVLPSDEVTPLQRHICIGTLGASAQWEANGTAGTDLSIGAEYQETASSTTRWGCEATVPLTWVKSKTAPVILEASTTHNFANGTTTMAQMRGSTASRETWQCAMTSSRKLSTRWFLGGAYLDHSEMAGDLRASCGGGIKALTGEPANFFVSLSNIPSPKHELQQDDDDNDSSSWTLSNPQLSLRAGLLPAPYHASITYEEFGKPWISFFASWSWHAPHDCSKIKMMLSTHLWGSFEDNDTTKLSTGLKHDQFSGWVWLWEWEELDWKLKVPISLAASQNGSWLLLAIGSHQIAGQAIHNSVRNFLASYFVLKVARSMLGDWTSTSSKTNQESRQRDATISEESFRDDDDTDGNKKGEAEQQRLQAFRSLMERVAERKRQEELAKNGLVIMSAVVTKGNQQALSSLEEDVDLQSFLLTTATTHQHNLTDILQFWVCHGKLRLPPLTSQKAPHYYTVGGSLLEGDASKDSLWWWSSDHPISKVCQEQWRTVTDWLQHSFAGVKKMESGGSSVHLTIRYQNEGNVYEISLREGDQIQLPDANALLLGPAASIK